MDSIEFRHVTDHQVQVQLLRNVMLGPGRGAELADLLERKERRPIGQSQVEPIAPGFVVLVGWRLFVARSVHETEELTPELRCPPGIRGVENDLSKPRRHRFHERRLGAILRYR